MKARRTLQKSEPTGPSQSTLKRLFGKSSNRCAFPRCPNKMIEGETVVGEACHIKAANSGGPRYDPAQTPQQRHCYDNLILLCGNHHTVIDDDVEAYTVERLLKMKADHESTSGEMSDDEAARGAQLLMSFNQSGGITAHTIHAHTINVHPSPVADPSAAWARVRKIHDQRVNEIEQGKTPVQLLGGGLLVLHVVPFSSPDTPQVPSIDKIMVAPDRFPPILDPRSRNWEIRHDGLVTASNNDGMQKPQRAYVHVRRSGIVESVASSIARGEQKTYLILPHIEAMIVQYVRIYSTALQNFDVPGPYAIMVSLLDVMGRQLERDFMLQSWSDEYSVTLQSDRVDLIEVTLPAAPADNAECGKAIKPLLDHLANAAGLASAPFFDEDGNYILKI